MLECKICGCKFNAASERHYIARDGARIGFSAVVGVEEPIYDAFDCPQCGCQVIAKERKRGTFGFDVLDEQNEQEDADGEDAN